MHDVLIIWVTLADSIQVYHLRCDGKHLEKYKKLHGQFGKLYRQGQPELLEPELEELREMLSKMQPVTRDHNSQPWSIAQECWLTVIICGYDPRSFEVSADYNEVADKFYSGDM